MAAGSAELAWEPEVPIRRKAVNTVVVGPRVPEDGRHFHAGLDETASGQRRLPEQRQAVPLSHAVGLARDVQRLGNLGVGDHGEGEITILVKCFNFSAETTVV